jgi:hypothetical protein
MRWMSHAIHIEEFSNAYKILVRKPEVVRLLGRPSVYGKIILKLILNYKV